MKKNSSEKNKLEKRIFDRMTERYMRERAFCYGDLDKIEVDINNNFIPRNEVVKIGMEAVFYMLEVHDDIDQALRIIDKFNLLEDILNSYIYTKKIKKMIVYWADYENREHDQDFLLPSNFNVVIKRLDFTQDDFKQHIIDRCESALSDFRGIELVQLAKKNPEVCKWLRLLKQEWRIEKMLYYILSPYTNHPIDSTIEVINFFSFMEGYYMSEIFMTQVSDKVFYLLIDETPHTDLAHKVTSVCKLPRLNLQNAIHRAIMHWLLYGRISHVKKIMKDFCIEEKSVLNRETGDLLLAKLVEGSMIDIFEYEQYDSTTQSYGLFRFIKSLKFVYGQNGYNKIITHRDYHQAVKKAIIKLIISEKYFGHRAFYNSENIAKIAKEFENYHGKMFDLAEKNILIDYFNRAKRENQIQDANAILSACTERLVEKLK